MSAELPPQPAPTATALSDAVARALRSGFAWGRAGTEPEAERELRHSLRALCADARRRDLRAEQIIVTLKESWAVLPEARALPPGPRRTELLARFVTICIDEYYAAHAD